GERRPEKVVTKHTNATTGGCRRQGARHLEACAGPAATPAAQPGVALLVAGSGGGDGSQIPRVAVAQISSSHVVPISAGDLPFAAPSPQPAMTWGRLPQPEFVVRTPEMTDGVQVPARWILLSG